MELSGSSINLGNVKLKEGNDTSSSTHPTSIISKGDVEKWRSTVIETNTVSVPKRQSFKTLIVIGDGNCLFRAASLQIFGSEIHHGELRLEAVQYISSNWDDLQPFILSECGTSDRQRYCELMSKCGTFGSSVECLALSEVRDINIYIHISSQSDKRQKRFINFDVLPTAISKSFHPKSLYLLLSGNKSAGHFDLLHCLEGRHSTLNDSLVSSKISDVSQLKFASQSPSVSTRTLPHIVCTICNCNFACSCNRLTGSVATNTKWIQCISCMLWFHCTCINLTKRPKRFLCPSCQPNSHDSPEPSQNDILEHLQKLRSRGRILPRIPKGSRPLAAEKYGECIIDVLQEDSLNAWFNLLTFSHACLKAPRKKRKPGKFNLDGSLTSKVNQLLRNFPNILCSKDTPQVKKPVNITAVNQDTLKSELRLAEQVSAKLTDGDIKGALRLACSNDKLAPYNEENEAIMREKHPSKPVNCKSPPNPVSCDPMQISQDDLRSAINNFNRGSGPGIDGLHPQHLIDMVDPRIGDFSLKLLTLLTRFINKILRGEVPDFIRPIFFGASLISLEKNDGGLRPIAVGLTLRRLASKCVVKSISDRVVTFLRPFQMGFGISGGAEAIVHAVRSLVQCTSSEIESQILLKIDFKNAFNLIRRDVILDSIFAHFPEIFNYVLSSYGSSSTLLYNHSIIYSQEGVQQGDPLGPLLFCVAAQPLLTRLKSKFNAWYLDDGSISGSLEAIIHDFNLIESEGPSFGLFVNKQKCELYFFKPVESSLIMPLSECKIIDQNDLELLGAPIGKSSESKILQRKISNLKTMCQRLSILEPHQSFFLLRNCIAIPRLQYLLRATNLHGHALLTEFDYTLRIIFRQILNIQLTDMEWLQATLPVNFGGLGIRCATDISLPSFISSCLHSSELVASLLAKYHNIPISGLSDATVSWKKVSNLDILPNSKKQRDWDHPIVEVAQKLILNNATDTKDQARLKAVAYKDSSYWLNALPSSNLGTLLSRNLIRVAVGLRLGSKIIESHICRCGAKVDISGTHGLSCQKSKGRITRHIEANAIIKRALSRIELQPILEPTGLNARSDGKRPDGMTMVPYSHGKCLVWDFTSVDTLCLSHRPITALNPGSAAEKAENAKIEKYRTLSKEYRFTPIAIETMGPYGPNANLFIQDICKRLVQCSGNALEGTWFKQRLSIAIQRGNAISILGTLPNEDEDQIENFRQDLISERFEHNKRRAQMIRKKGSTSDLSRNIIQAGQQAAKQVKEQLAEKAMEAAKAAEVALPGKEALVEQLQEELKDAELVVNEETASLTQLQQTVGSASKSAEQFQAELKIIQSAVQLAQGDAGNAQHTLEGIQQQLNEKQQILEAAKTSDGQLLKTLGDANVDLTQTKDAAKKAEAAAAQSKSNAQRNSRRAIERNARKKK